jgi:hypothetical protein
LLLLLEGLLEVLELDRETDEELEEVLIVYCALLFF